MGQIIEIISALISWPMATIIGILCLRGPGTQLVERLIASSDGTAKLGPVEVRLGQIASRSESSLDRINDITVVMAKSRVTELEITLTTFGSSFPVSSRKELEAQIQQLKLLAEKASSTK